MYLEIDDGFLEHPKTLRFCRAIGDPCGAVYLLRLWTWATKSARDGDLGDMAPEDIELTIRWAGAPGLCYRALVASRFVDADEDGATIHNWDKRTGGAIVRMEKQGDARRVSATERKRKQRQAEREKKAAEAGHADVTRDPSVTVTPVTPLDKARPDETSQGAQSDACAPDPTEPVAEPDPVALAQAVVDAVAEAGGPPVALLVRSAPALPELPKAFGPRDLLQAFAKARGAALNVPDWLTPGGKSYGKAQALLEQGDPGLVADLEPAVQLFCGRLKAETAKEPKLADVTFAFASFLERLQGLREELHRQKAKAAKPAPPPADCEFHAYGRNSGKFAPGWAREKAPRCPECKHLHARASPRKAGDVTSIGELLGSISQGG